MSRRPGALRRSSVPLNVGEAGNADADASSANPAPSRPRVTPRNSTANEALVAAAKETPYANLQRLAGVIQRPTTPQQRASSAGSPSTRRSTRRTPSGQGQTPGGAGALRPVPSRRAAPTTPHAVRAHQQRRAAGVTPGNRRRSGRATRLSPRDNLRALSRVLAPVSKPVEPSPEQPQSERRRATLPRDDLDIGPDPPAPRLSLPLDYDEDDDSYHLHPPRLSSPPFDEGNVTQQSVELPRRANFTRQGARLSRGSFGSIRLSDRFADLNELGLGAFSEGGVEESVIRPDFDDYEEVDAGEEQENQNDVTQDLREAFIDESPRRQSDIIAAPVPDEHDDTTFVFSFPQRNREAREPSVSSEGEEEEDEEEVEIAPVPELDVSMQPQYIRRLRPAPETVSKMKMPRSNKVKKIPKISRHGIPYPSLPQQVVKKLASTFAKASGGGKSAITRETLHAIMQASDWFFEQVSEDLSAYAKHAHRKTIDETDMLTLMKRQRQVDATTTPFSLAQKYLPRELLQDIRMAQVKKTGRKTRRLDDIDEGDEEG